MRGGAARSEVGLGGQRERERERKCVRVCVCVKGREGGRKEGRENEREGAKGRMETEGESSKMETICFCQDRARRRRMRDRG